APHHAARRLPHTGAATITSATRPVATLSPADALKAGLSPISGDRLQRCNCARTAPPPPPPLSPTAARQPPPPATTAHATAPTPPPPPPHPGGPTQRARPPPPHPLWRADAHKTGRSPQFGPPPPVVICGGGGPPPPPPQRARWRRERHHPSVRRVRARIRPPG